MVFLRSKMKLDKKMQNAATDAAVTRMMQNKWRCGVKGLEWSWLAWKSSFESCRRRIGVRIET